MLGVARAFRRRRPARRASTTSPSSISGWSVWLIPCGDGVPGAVAECHAAGIRVVMVTGDYPRTAARSRGWPGSARDDVVTGADLERMSDESLRSGSGRSVSWRAPYPSRSCASSMRSRRRGSRGDDRRRRERRARVARRGHRHRDGRTRHRRRARGGRSGRDWTTISRRSSRQCAWAGGSQQYPEGNGLRRRGPCSDRGHRTLAGCLPDGRSSCSPPISRSSNSSSIPRARWSSRPSRRSRRDAPPAAESP